MKIKITLLIVAALLIAAPAFSQTTQCTTTLAAGITTAAATGISLTSAACLSTLPPQSLNQYLYVDNELIYVRLQAQSPTTWISTTRGASGTHATLHNSGATVYIGPGTAFSQSVTSHEGGCNATTLLYLPLIVVSPIVSQQGIYDCRITGTSPSIYQWLKLASGTNNASAAQSNFSSWCSGTVGSAETEYIKDIACTGATAAGWGWVVPTAGYLSNFRATSTANFLGTGGSTFTVLKNTVATTIVCAPTAATKLCSDQTHAVQVAAGDIITVTFLSSTSDTASNLSVTLGLY